MTGFTAADYLTPFRDAIPPTLIAPANLAAMEQIAAQLPGALTSFFGFECRLGENDAATDILFALDAREMAALAGRRQGGGLPTEFWKAPTWQRVRELSAAVTEPLSPLAEKVDNLWLDFDVTLKAQDCAPAPVPSVFFGSQQLRSNVDLDWFTEQALPILYGAHLSPQVKTQVLQCIHTLPPQALVFQTGAMMSRQPPFVRLCVSNLSPAEYVD